MAIAFETRQRLRVIMQNTEKADEIINAIDSTLSTANDYTDANIVNQSEVVTSTV